MFYFNDFYNKTNAHHLMSPFKILYLRNDFSKVTTFKICNLNRGLFVFHFTLYNPCYYYFLDLIRTGASVETLT